MCKLIICDSITSTASAKAPAKVHPLLKNRKKSDKQPLRRELLTDAEKRKEEARRHRVRLNLAIGKARNKLNIKKRQYKGRRLHRKSLRMESRLEGRY